MMAQDTSFDMSWALVVVIAVGCGLWWWLVVGYWVVNDLSSSLLMVLATW